MRIVTFPIEVWAIAGGDDEQPCLHLRESRTVVVEICFDDRNRGIVQHFQTELSKVAMALGIEEPRS